MIAIQIYLSGHAILQFYDLPPERQKSKRRYIVYLVVIILLSAIRFILYVREMGTPQPIDMPGLWHGVQNFKPTLEVALSSAATALLSLIGDAFLVRFGSVLELKRCSPDCHGRARSGERV